MACVTFLNLSKLLKNEIRLIKDNQNDMDSELFICKIIKEMNPKTEKMSEHLKIIFFECIGHLVSVFEGQELLSLLALILNDFLLKWKEFIDEFQINKSILFVTT